MFRDHSHQQTPLAARWRANRNDALAWKLNGLRPRPWTVLAKPLRKIGQWWV